MIEVGHVADATVAWVDAAVGRRLVAITKRLEALTDERDALIVEARKEGATLREIGLLIGMTHVGVKKLLERQRG